MDSWSVVLFCFNEVGTVEKVHAEICAVMAQMAIESWEIIIVDDGSTDGSRAIIERLGSSHPKTRAVLHPQNKGIGYALRSGYEAAQFALITAVPADGQFDVQELVPYSTLENKTFISFYRKENTTYSLFRNILSAINKKVNERFIGITLRDVNWVKIYPAQALKSLDLELTSSLVESEICAKLIFMGYAPIEVHSVYKPRVSGVSKGASFKIIKKAALDTLTLLHVMRRFRKSHDKPA